MSGASMLSWDVFLIHSSVDKPRVQVLYEQLVDAGLRVFFDAESAEGGTRWPTAFASAMDESRCFVVVCSKQSVGAGGYYESEIVRAIQLEREAQRRVWPVLIDGKVKVPYGLEAHQWTEAPDEASATAFAVSLAETLANSQAPPAVPTVQIGLIDVPGRRDPISPTSDRRLVGRSDKLSEVHNLLTGGNTELTVHAISGLGGIGKTALAVEYCHQHRDAYPFIWWVDASTPGGITRSYQELADELGVEIVEDQDVKEAMDRHLRNYRGWLAVFDNVTDRKQWDQIKPDVNTGQTIITSRSNLKWASAVPLDLIERNDAIEWIIEAAGNPTSDTEHAAAAAIADRLDGLALALAMASAYITETGCSVYDYHQILENDQDNPLDERDLLPGNEPTVYLTWTPSIEHLRNAGKAKAIELLEIASFYAPKKIPLRIFEGEPFGATGGELNLAIRDLRNFSLVDRNGDFFDVHSLVQAVTRHNLAVAASSTSTGDV